MVRSRLCRVCSTFHPLTEPWPGACVGHFGHRADPAPNIRTDGMDALRSMADGRVYDSKSRYYASVRAAGCEIAGDDRSGFGTVGGHQPKHVGADIKRAIEELKSR